MTMVGAVGIGGIIGALKLFVSEQMERVETRMNSITTDDYYRHRRLCR
ncbi:MAG: hypothetical protein MKZ95_15590 [Pirellulales bacterium]|nr:hypothetical protein [Pirellulales bacterium]